MDYELMKRSEWARSVRAAVNQLHMKRQNKGFYHGFTYAEFRDFFKNAHEESVKLGIHNLTNGDWPKLYKACLAGMCVPDWKLVKEIES